MATSFAVSPSPASTAKRFPTQASLSPGPPLDGKTPGPGPRSQDRVASERSLALGDAALHGGADDARQLHVLPDRFMRIRHYGCLANSARKRWLPRVHALLGGAPAAVPLPPPAEPETWEAMLRRLTGKDVTRCPHCGAGGFLIVEVVPATARLGDLALRVKSP